MYKSVKDGGFVRVGKAFAERHGLDAEVQYPVTAVSGNPERQVLLIDVGGDRKLEVGTREGTHTPARIIYAQDATP